MVDRGNNDDVLNRINENRTLLDMILKMKVNWLDIL